ncbi:MAG: recombination protein O N-terminal domain-containing protein [Schleiferiaceae bacterium]|nr:recombination protein O N-terminal domain-containing protein [Schleiferiaceae bacterium]
MSLQAVDALMLGKIAYGDKAHILKLWTRPYGIQSYMVHSIRSARSGLRPALLLPMTSLEAMVSHRDKGQLEKISEVRASPVWSRIQSDPVGQTLCLFAAELLLKTLKTGDSTQDFYDDVVDMLQRWDQAEASWAMAAVELLALVAHHLGFALDPENYLDGWAFDLREGQCAPLPILHPEILSPEATGAIMEWFANSEKIPAKAVRQELMDGLLQGLRWHHAGMGEIHSLEILRGLHR